MRSILILNSRHLSYLFSGAAETPLQVLFPDAEQGVIPLPKVFTVIALGLHINLSFRIHPARLRNAFQRLGADVHVQPLSYQLSYAIAAVAPTLCLFIGRPWTTIIWWSIAAFVTFVVQTVQDSIDQGNEGIATLESMKYIAPGA